MKIKTKIIFVSALAVVIVMIASISAYIVVSQGKSNKPQTLEAQENAIHDQILKLDNEYGDKMTEITKKQEQNNCVAWKDVEMTKTLTGEKTTEKQLKTISIEGVCKDLQTEKDNLATERSYKESQLQAKIDLLIARPEAEREKAMQTIRTFMGEPDLQLTYIATRRPSNFNVGKVTNQDAGGFTMEDVAGWERRVEVYQQKDFIDDLCEVYEYEVDIRNNQLVEVHVRYPDGIPATPNERMSLCSSYGTMGWPLVAKDQIEKIAFAYLGRVPESTGSMSASSSIQPQYIPSKEGVLSKPAQNEWRWEDKSYKLPEGLYSDAFAYPVLRISISSGGKLIYYFNSTGLFNN